VGREDFHGRKFFGHEKPQRGEAATKQTGRIHRLDAETTLRNIGQWLATTQFYCGFSKREICHVRVFLCDLCVWAVLSFRNLPTTRYSDGEVWNSGLILSDL